MKILHGKYGVEEVLDLRNVAHTQCMMVKRKGDDFLVGE